MSWEDEAACAGDSRPDAWFPDGKDKAARKYALRRCFSCPVRDLCLEAALRVERKGGDVFGIRGAMTKKDRERLLGRREQLAS